MYRNEEDIGRAIAAAGFPRVELFVTTKIAPAAQGFEPAYAAALASLTKLGLEYVDLLLIHWPGSAGTFQALVFESNLCRQPQALLYDCVLIFDLIITIHTYTYTQVFT